MKKVSATAGKGAGADSGSGLPTSEPSHEADNGGNFIEMDAPVTPPPSSSSSAASSAQTPAAEPSAQQGGASAAPVAKGGDEKMIVIEKPSAQPTKPSTSTKSSSKSSSSNPAPSKGSVVVQDNAPAVEVSGGPEINTAPAARAKAKKAAVAAAPVAKFEFDTRDILHCRWEPVGTPMTYATYNPVTRVATVEYGMPRKEIVYANTSWIAGRNPYLNQGFTLISSSGKTIFSVRVSANGRIAYELTNSYPYEAAFGIGPGAPRGEPAIGVCWTGNQPARNDDNLR